MSKIEDSIETTKEAVKSESQTLFSQLYDYTLTPYPAWIFAGGLAASPVLSKSQVPARQGIFANSSSNVPIKLVRVGPTNKSVLLFSSAMALGGYMTYDGDYLNGAGFTSVWSSLYLLVNGKNTINSLKYGRLWPIVLTVGALSNAVLYGERFVWK